MWGTLFRPSPGAAFNIVMRWERNEPFGSRPEPGAYLIASILPLPPGEVPEGRARGVQDTATRVRSESEV